jgi:hypothetical protein
MKGWRAVGTSKQELLVSISGSHASLAAIVAAINDDRLRDLAGDNWTGKDVLAHLSWWHGHCATVINALREGREPDERADPAGTTDEINEFVYRSHLEDSPAVARREFAQSFERLMNSIAPLSDDDLFASDRWTWLGGEPFAEMPLWDTSRHYEAHRDELAALADDTRTSG